MNNYLTILLLLLLSCQSVTQEKIEQVAKDQYEERRNNFLAEKIIFCSRELYRKAQNEADSILRIESKLAKMDSIQVPHDTLKPDKPEVQFPDYRKPERLNLDSLPKAIK